MKLTTEKTISILVVFCCSLILALPGQAQVGQPEVSFDLRHDISTPLRDMSPNPAAITRHHVIPLGRPTPPETKSPQPDPVLQTSVGPLVSTTAGLNILGVGVGITPSYSDCCAPPDTNGAVGATQFVQWVNLDFAVFDKTTGALWKTEQACDGFL